MECTFCGFKDSEVVRSFFDLIVTVGCENSSIEDCIDRSFGQERLDGVNCVSCWLKEIEKRVESCQSELKIKALESIKFLKSLEACDVDEASRTELQLGERLLDEFEADGEILQIVNGVEAKRTKIKRSQPRLFPVKCE